MTENEPQILFEDLSESEKRLYADIESLIIIWEILQDETAGVLTRRIMSLIKNSER